MDNNTFYLLETLVVTVPASGVIGYIVYNLDRKLKACRQTLYEVSDKLADANKVADALTAEVKAGRVTISELRGNLRDANMRAAKIEEPKVGLLRKAAERVFTKKDDGIKQVAMKAIAEAMPVIVTNASEHTMKKLRGKEVL